MTRIRLELEKLTVHRPKERWKIYFVVAVGNPDNPAQMLVSVLPVSPILVVPEQNNIVHFSSGKPGSEGLYILSTLMPDTREMNVHLYVRHSRRNIHEIGKVLSDIQAGIGGNAFGILTNVLGSANPWLAIAKDALPMVGQILEKIPDRDLGFISLFERFGPEFENQEEIDNEKRGGHVTVVYTWSVDRD